MSQVITLLARGPQADETFTLPIKPGSLGGEILFIQEVSFGSGGVTALSTTFPQAANSRVSENGAIGESEGPDRSAKLYLVAMRVPATPADS